MEYTRLPKIKADKHMDFPHFPSRFHAAVFRLWEMCGAEKLAMALSVPIELVEKAAADMGLPKPQCIDKWAERGYISIIRSAWHILPYGQLLRLLGWTEDKLAVILKEDDFLDIKLGGFKPYCEDVLPCELTDDEKARLAKIKNTMETHFGDTTDDAMPFDFFKSAEAEKCVAGCDELRLIYSYCGLYAGVLDNDISISYPDELLKMYKNAGINAVWLPVVLYQMGPFPFDESQSEGWQMRRERLNELVRKAGKCGIKVYLYLNEPRCMPLDFFEKHPELMGSTQHDTYGALCTSVPQVMDYLRNSIRDLCQNVPGLGGFFTITCSEYLTHCKSRREATECPRCKDIPTYRLVADVLTAISEESRKVDPNLKTIAWTWAWDSYMTEEEIKKCIDLLPKEVIIQAKSETKKEFTVGGIKGKVADYSMSVPGPGEPAKIQWNYAKETGHETCAKVQVNDTYECSTVPYLPVFDLVREHMIGLREAGVRHLMLSWTLGGAPSVNLQIASECLKDPDEGKYTELLVREYGDYAKSVKEAATLFSDAFREFPFSISNLYYGPPNAGPSNLLYLTPSGFESTMTCYAYDDLDKWRENYPREVYINQLKKLADGWKMGLEKIDDMPDCDLKQVSHAAYAIFNSSYLQSEFINLRDSEDKDKLCEIVVQEREMALLLHSIMRKNSLIGYEAANHYYYTKSMLKEKVLNCDYITEKLTEIEN